MHGRLLAGIGGLASLLAVAGCAGGRRATPAAAAMPDAAGVVTVTLSDFAFTPERIGLRANQPVRLHLVNASGGGHDFSAPALFAASRVAEGSPAPKSGGIEVASHSTADIVLTPLVSGRYDLACTHPLHELFGMSGTIEVTP